MSNKNFYHKGEDYWKTIPATLDGMLGGFADISNTDIQTSSRFLVTFLQAKEKPTGTERALDCGAGIGRITKNLLLKHFKFVDMVEQNKDFLDASHQHIDVDSQRVLNRFNSGLQDFIPQQKYYDVIWCQWVTGHLTDEDFILFLKRCKKGLNENGIIVVKDNLSSDDLDMDNQDGSVTRPRSLLVKLFNQAGLQIICERKQYKFPKGLYEVKMFALR